MSLVPAGASLAPSRWLCRLLRHSGLEWNEEVTHPSPTATRSRLVDARCSCGREQKRLRVVYPSARTITATGAQRERGGQGT